MTTPAQRDLWTKTLADLPPIPLGKTARGKLPPRGVGDDQGTATILPAEKYGKTSNSENPELYVAFPYRLYGVGKPNLELARNTYAARLFPQNTCWGQDGTQSAVLGLTQRRKRKKRRRASSPIMATSVFPGSGKRATIGFLISTTAAAA